MGKIKKSFANHNSFYLAYIFIPVDLVATAHVAYSLRQ